jgi:hypothetical protein
LQLAITVLILSDNGTGKIATIGAAGPAAGEKQPHAVVIGQVTEGHVAIVPAPLCTHAISRAPEAWSGLWGAQVERSNSLKAVVCELATLICSCQWLFVNRSRSCMAANYNRVPVHPSQPLAFEPVCSSWVETAVHNAHALCCCRTVSYPRESWLFSTWGRQKTFT